MTTELDKEFGPEIKAALAEVGTIATFIFDKDIEDTYDPKTGAVTLGVPVREDILITPPGPYARNLVDGDLILSTDLRTLVAGLDIPAIPYNTQVVEWRGVEYTIEDVIVIPSGDDDAAYELQLRLLNGPD